MLASLVQTDCPTMPEGHQLISVKEKYNKIALIIIKNRNMRKHIVLKRSRILCTDIDA